MTACLGILLGLSVVGLGSLLGHIPGAAYLYDKFILEFAGATPELESESCGATRQREVGP